MQTCYVMMGKTGDILSCLPLLKQVENGSPTNIVVSKRYGKVVEGLPNICVHTYPGDWQDLRGAITWAKQRFQRVIVPQTFGKDFPIQHRAPSWQHDQLLRMTGVTERGVLELPRRPLPPKMEGMIPTSNTILIADSSESSPFPHKDELAKLVTEACPDHKLVYLSKIKLDDFRDFTALYDAAALLISIDTAHLHLSAASKVPVFALATDTPERWHGSAYHPRFKFYCRYSELLGRKDEFVRALKQVVNKLKEVAIEPMLTTYSHGYNPSIIQWQGRTVGAYRWHPDQRQWRTELVFQDGQDFRLAAPIGLEEHSLEDPRLFIHQDKLHISFVASLARNNSWICAVLYSELIHDGEGWKIGAPKHINYGSNAFTGMEKNWCPFSINGKLYFIYGSEPHQMVIQVDGEKVVTEHKSVAPKWDFGGIRGGAVLVHGDKLLRFFHSQRGQSHVHYKFRYYIGASIMQATPPFQTLAVSRYPIFGGNELWVRDYPRWKPQVVFPGGAVVEGGDFRLAFGVNDSMCVTAKLSESDLNL